MIRWSGGVLLACVFLAGQVRVSGCPIESPERSWGYEGDHFTVIFDREPDVPAESTKAPHYSFHHVEFKAIDRLLLQGNLSRAKGMLGKIAGTSRGRDRMMAQERLDLITEDHPRLPQFKVYLKARQAYEYGPSRFPAAVSLLRGLLSQGCGALTDDTLCLLGTLLLQEGRPEGVDPLKQCLKQFPRSPKTPLVLYRLACQSLRDGSEKSQQQALAYSNDFLRQFKNSFLADDMLLVKARLLARDLEQLGQAKELLIGAIRTHGTGDMGWRFQEMLAMLETGEEENEEESDRSSDEGPTISWEQYLAHKKKSPRTAYLAYGDVKWELPRDIGEAIRDMDGMLDEFPASDAFFTVILDSVHRTEEIYSYSYGRSSVNAKKFSPPPSRSQLDEFRLKCFELYEGLILNRPYDPKVPVLLSKILRLDSPHRIEVVNRGGTHGKDRFEMIYKRLPAERIIRLIDAVHAIHGLTSNQHWILDRWIAEEPTRYQLVRSIGLSEYLLTVGKYVRLMQDFPDDPLAVTAMVREVRLLNERSDRKDVQVTLAFCQARASRADPVLQAELLIKAARLERNLGDPETAIRYARRAMALDRSQEWRDEYLWVLGESLLKTGKNNDGIAVLNTLISEFSIEPDPNEGPYQFSISLSPVSTTTPASILRPSRYTELALRRLAFYHEDRQQMDKALHFYLRMRSQSDAAYLLDVLMSIPTIEKFLNENPGHPYTPEIQYTLAIRYLRKDDFKNYRKYFALADASLRGSPFLTYQENSSRHGITKEYFEEYVVLVYDKSAQAAQWEEYQRRYATADTSEEKARNLYDWGTSIYKGRESQFSNYVLWRSSGGWYLRFLGDRTEKERPIFKQHRRECNRYLRAMALYERVYQEFPESSVADKSLYSAALCDFHGAHDCGLSSSSDGVKRMGWIYERYPRSTLADDGLYWEGVFDGKKADGNMKIIREKYPDGDIAQIFSEEKKGRSWDPDTMLFVHNKNVRMRETDPNDVFIVTVATKYPEIKMSPDGTCTVRVEATLVGTDSKEGTIVCSVFRPSFAQKGDLKIERVDSVDHQEKIVPKGTKVWNSYTKTEVETTCDRAQAWFKDWKKGEIKWMDIVLRPQGNITSCNLYTAAAAKNPKTDRFIHAYPVEKEYFRDDGGMPLFSSYARWRKP